MPQYQQVVITLEAGVLAEVRQRLDTAAHKGQAGNNTSGAISEALARYYEALRRARIELAAHFTSAECGLILEACSGITWRAASIPLVRAKIEDALLGDAAARWNVSAPALAEELRTLSYIQAAALADAIERWWPAQMAGAAADYGALLAEPQP